MPDVKRIIEVIISATNRSGPGVAAASADLQKIGGQLTTVGSIALATGTAVAAGMAAIVTSTANAEDRMRDLAIQSRSTVEDMSTLKYVAEQNGTSIDAVAQSVKFLAKNAGEAASGNKEMAQTFADVGVNVRDTNGNLKGGVQLLFEVADGLKALKGTGRDTTLQLALMGRGANEMTEFLSLGSAGLREGQAEARKFGAEISTKAAAGADNFNDSLNTLKTSTDGLKRSIGDQLVPTIVPMVKGMAEAVAQAGAWARANPGLAQTIVGVAVALIGGGGLAVALGVLTTSFTAIIPAATAAWVAITGPVGLVTTAIVALGGLVVALKTAQATSRGAIQKSLDFIDYGAGGYKGWGAPPATASAGRAPNQSPFPPFRPGYDPSAPYDQNSDYTMTNAQAIAAMIRGTRGNRSGRPGPGGTGPGFEPADTGVTDPGLTFSLSFVEQLATKAGEALASIPSGASLAVSSVLNLGDVIGNSLVNGFKDLGAAVGQWVKQTLAGFASVIAKAFILWGILSILGIGGGASFGSVLKGSLGLSAAPAALGPIGLTSSQSFGTSFDGLSSGRAASVAPTVNQIVMPVQYYFGRETDAREAAVKIQRLLDEQKRGTRL